MTAWYVPAGIAVLVIYRCITNHPKNSGTKQFTLLPDSMGHGFRQSIAGMICLCSMMSEASAGKMKQLERLDDWAQLGLLTRVPRHGLSM